jgi:hypothetical protein
MLLRVSWTRRPATCSSAATGTSSAAAAAAAAAAAIAAAAAAASASCEPGPGGRSIPRRARCAASVGVGLYEYKFSSVHHSLHAAWFQPLKLDILVSTFAFNGSTCTATRRASRRAAKESGSGALDCVVACHLPPLHGKDDPGRAGFPRVELRVSSRRQVRGTCRWMWVDGERVGPRRAPGGVCDRPTVRTV